MNLKKLKQAEQRFLERYPGGFENPEMVNIARKHKVDKMTAYVHEWFAKGNFMNPALVVENMSRLVSRASVISLFEKPKFRDFTLSLPSNLKLSLAFALEELLHGKEEKGFESLLEILKQGKLGHWPVMTVFQAYHRPESDVFIKPTTTRWVIQHLELKDLHYDPAPSWSFYQAYRSVINEIKSEVDPSLSPSNLAFTGFLMMSMEAR